jgi:hypothetical protein
VTAAGGGVLPGRGADQAGPVHGNGLDTRGQPRAWLRISQGVEQVDNRLQQLDLAMAAAMTLALILSAACATLLAQKVMERLERSLRRLREFELDASDELRAPWRPWRQMRTGLLDCGEGDRAQRQRFEANARATDPLRRLVEDPHTMARQEQGGPHQAPGLNLGELVRQQVAIYSDAFTLRGQRVWNSWGGDCWFMGMPGCCISSFATCWTTPIATARRDR